MPGKLKILTVALAVAGGLLAGFAISTLLYRYRILRVPGEPVLMRMTRELKLTPDQRDQIAAILQEARLKVRESRVEALERRRRIFLDAFGKIRGALTVEQQAKFDRDFGRPFLRRVRRFQRRFGGPMPGGPPPAPATAIPPAKGAAPAAPQTAPPPVE